MSQIIIPDQMTAVVLDSYTGVQALRVEQRPVPKPGSNQVLVKIAAASINPSDLAFIDGDYGFKKPPPVVPGFEGSGLVVAAGSGIMGRYLNGKRVACVTQSEGDGTWAEYLVTSAGFALPLDKSVSMEQGAMSVVNPLTAMAFLSIAQQDGHKTIINTAAASALGQMVDRLGQSEGVQVINIVRRQEQVDLLQQQGAAIVFNSRDPDFEQELHDACQQHKVHLAFDAIGGEMTLKLLDAMPDYSKVTVYGGLSLKPAQVDPGHLIFQGKSVDGFWLTPWLTGKNMMQLLMLWRRVQKLLATDLRSDIRGRYALGDAQKAVNEYQSQMTGGKVLFVP